MLNDKDCRGCIWNDQCGGEKTCEYYDPWDKEEEADAFIEENRYVFRAEFEEYISELL